MKGVASNPSSPAGVRKRVTLILNNETSNRTLTYAASMRTTQPSLQTPNTPSIIISSPDKQGNKTVYFQKEVKSFTNPAIKINQSAYNLSKYTNEQLRLPQSTTEKPTLRMSPRKSQKFTDLFANLNVQQSPPTIVINAPTSPAAIQATLNMSRSITKSFSRSRQPQHSGDPNPFSPLYIPLTNTAITTQCSNTNSTQNIGSSTMQGTGIQRKHLTGGLLETNSERRQKRREILLTAPMGTNSSVNNSIASTSPRHHSNKGSPNAHSKNHKSIVPASKVQYLRDLRTRIRNSNQVRQTEERSEIGEKQASITRHYNEEQDHYVKQFERIQELSKHKHSQHKKHNHTSHDANSHKLLDKTRRQIDSLHAKHLEFQVGFPQTLNLKKDQPLESVVRFDDGAEDLSFIIKVLRHRKTGAPFTFKALLSVTSHHPSLANADKVFEDKPRFTLGLREMRSWLHSSQSTVANLYITFIFSADCEVQIAIDSLSMITSGGGPQREIKSRIDPEKVASAQMSLANYAQRRKQPTSPSATNFIDLNTAGAPYIDQLLHLKSQYLGLSLQNRLGKAKERKQAWDEEKRVNKIESIEKWNNAKIRLNIQRKLMAPIIEEMKRKRELAKQLITILTTFKGFQQCMRQFQHRIDLRNEANFKIRVALRIIRLFTRTQKKYGHNVRDRIKKSIKNTFISHGVFFRDTSIERAKEMIVGIIREQAYKRAFNARAEKIYNGIVLIQTSNRKRKIAQVDQMVFLRYYWQNVKIELSKITQSPIVKLIFHSYYFDTIEKYNALFKNVM